MLVVDDPGTDAWGWLRRGQALEQAAGRIRDVRWGPRTLDVDVVTVDGVASSDPELLLPAPGTPDRATVLRPWLDVDPAAVPRPRSGRDAARRARPGRRGRHAPPRRPHTGAVTVTPIRPRDLILHALGTAVVVYLLVRLTYGSLPQFPLTAGLPFAVLGAAEAIGGSALRARIRGWSGTRPVPPLVAARPCWWRGRPRRRGRSWRGRGPGCSPTSPRAAATSPPRRTTPRPPLEDVGEPRSGGSDPSCD